MFPQQSRTLDKVFARREERDDGVIIRSELMLTVTLYTRELFKKFSLFYICVAQVLPNVFSGCSFYVSDEFSSEERRRMERYILA